MAGKPRAKDWAPAFLAALEDTHLVCEAARRAGISRRATYDRRQRDEVFREAWDEVLERSTEILEQIALRRAAEGSDQLLMFLLRARRPEVYVERHQVRHAASIDGGPVGIALTPAGCPGRTRVSRPHPRNRGRTGAQGARRRAP